MIPHQSYAQIFRRFLHFGCLAWGGPIAQIAMIKKELVDEEKWIDVERFNRALAVYQVLPGPEAHELCVYFGMLARGRMGAILAGLGFMLPGFLLMFTISWIYLRFGISSPHATAAFTAVQAAVVAIIFRAVHRIGNHALGHKWLWAVALLAFGWQLFSTQAMVRMELDAGPLRTPAQRELFISGLKAGLLTFGGAYTAIPFIQHDAVEVGAWMTNRQFLDGLALSGMLPAPLIIFSTFVGYLGGGPLGALLVTMGIFLPAFGFTLIGHDFFERIALNPRLRCVLDGITAGLVGMIAATAIQLAMVGVTSWSTLAVFMCALAALYRWNAKWVVAAVLASAATFGLIFDPPSDITPTSVPTHRAGQ